MYVCSLPSSSRFLFLNIKTTFFFFCLKYTSFILVLQSLAKLHKNRKERRCLHEAYFFDESTCTDRSNTPSNYERNLTRPCHKWNFCCSEKENTLHCSCSWVPPGMECVLGAVFSNKLLEWGHVSGKMIFFWFILCLMLFFKILNTCTKHHAYMCIKHFWEYSSSFFSHALKKKFYVIFLYTLYSYYYYVYLHLLGMVKR